MTFESGCWEGNWYYCLVNYRYARQVCFHISSQFLGFRFMSATLKGWKAVWCFHLWSMCYFPIVVVLQPRKNSYLHRIRLPSSWLSLLLCLIAMPHFTLFFPKWNCSVKIRPDVWVRINTFVDKISPVERYSSCKWAPRNWFWSESLLTAYQVPQVYLLKNHSLCLIKTVHFSLLKHVQAFSLPCWENIPFRPLSMIFV